MAIYTETYTAERDEPVEFVHTIVDDATRARHYRCIHCGTKVWPANSEALDRFVTEHETCTA